MSDKSKLSADMIMVGKQLPVDVYHRNGMLLVKQGHYVLTPEQKPKLLQHGQLENSAKAAIVEKELRERRERQEQERRMAEAQIINPLVELDQLAHKVGSLLNRYFQAPHFSADIQLVVNKLLLLADKQPDGLIAACLLVPFTDYGSMHSLHTAAMLAILGRRLNLPQKEMQVLLSAALTMNIAATKLHTDLTKQDSALDASQKADMYAHPLLSSAILRDLGIDDERWHLLVQQHHEEWNGSGYPYGMKKEEIDPGAHLIRLTDVLTSLLVTQAHRAGRLPSIALGRMFKGEFSEFDPRFIALLIKELGIYPPGSFVRLANREIAVVTHRPGDGNTKHPKVAALRSASGEMYGEPLPRNTRMADYAIAEPISLKEAGVRPAFLIKIWNT